MEVLSEIQGEPQIVDGGFVASKCQRLGGDGQAFLITERHRVYIKFNGDWMMYSRLYLGI